MEITIKIEEYTGDEECDCQVEYSKNISDELYEVLKQAVLEITWTMPPIKYNCKVSVDKV